MEAQYTAQHQHHQHQHQNAQNQLAKEPLRMERKVVTRIPTHHGVFYVYMYHSSRDPQKEHMAFVYGDISSGEGIMTRVHSECFTGEVIGSLRCDCQEQLHTAQQRIAEHGAGVVVYLRQEGRGIGLFEKLKAYNLQDQGYDTLEANLKLGHLADARTYDEASLILKDLGVKTVKLLTNNMQKVEKLQKEGIPIVERIEMSPKNVTKDNLAYLQTKVEKMNHVLDLNPLAAMIDSNAGSNSPPYTTPSSPYLAALSFEKTIVQGTD